MSALPHYNHSKCEYLIINIANYIISFRVTYIIWISNYRIHNMSYHRNRMYSSLNYHLSPTNLHRPLAVLPIGCIATNDLTTTTSGEREGKMRGGLELLPFAAIPAKVMAGNFG